MSIKCEFTFDDCKSGKKLFKVWFYALCCCLFYSPTKDFNGVCLFFNLFLWENNIIATYNAKIMIVIIAVS